ncbi:MAG: lipoate protein ligase C-terminal domain-containing protein [Methanofastidiosum sp.]
MNIFEHKRQGGKVIGVSFNYKNDIFSEVRIYGDFFVFPEEGIDNLEKSINQKSLSELLQLIEDFFSSDIIFYGINKEDLQEVFKRAINEK